MNVVVTGASKGFGKSLASRFLQEGDTVLICARSEETLNAATIALGKQFPAAKLHATVADLSSKAGAETFAQWVLDHISDIDVLINNAGRFVPGSVYNEPAGALEEMVETNLYSAYHLTRALLPAMMKRRSGHIFNMCSIASLQAYSNGGAYSISKFAMLGFSKNLREEMKEWNIKVTTILPGAAYTDSWKGSGVDPRRIMEAADISEMIFAASRLSPQACVEEILLRPQLGDL